MSSSGEAANADSPVWTVQRILQWTAGFLHSKGIESPRLESELLLAHARQCPRIRLYTDFNDPLPESERAVMRELVRRRASREPLAYIIGTREFYGRPFEVGPGVLVPRPETETLVDVCLENIPRDQVRRVVEVGAGSGCIAVTIARQRPLCSVVATDVSTAAIQIAQRNVIRHDVANRVQLREDDVLSQLATEGQRFDGLVSNPPYLRDDERSSLQPEVAEHEPAAALFAGADGLDVVRRLVAQAPLVLSPGAFLLLELDPAQCQAVMMLLMQAGFQATTCRKDLNGSDRVVFAVWP
jgi:release factor glutamine methyltransferase